MAIAMTAMSSSGSSTGGGGGGGGGGGAGGGGGGGGVPAWWETIAKARSAIQSLSTILGALEALEAVQESERPAKGLLESHDVAASISARLDDAASGSASDALCQWLYDTFQAGDPDLQLVVLRYVPQVAGLYLSRVVSQGGRAEPLAGFEAVLLALYTSEVKARGGRPLSVHVADLGQASLYHQPLNASPEASLRPIVGQLCAPLEPHAALKSTKRAAVVGVALDLFYRKIALMTPAAKAEFCNFVQGWAGQNCSCVHKLDRPSDVARPAENRFEDEIVESPNGKIGRLSNDVAKFGIEDGSSGTANGGGSKSLIHLASSSSSSDSWNSSSALAVVAIGESRAKGARIPLPWELVQPILRILGHCLLAPLISQEVRDAASVATRMLFARVSHDLVPEAILATRSLVRLDVAARQANAIGRSGVAGPVAISATSSVKYTKKPEVLLVSK